MCAGQSRILFPLKFAYARCVATGVGYTGGVKSCRPVARAAGCWPAPVVAALLLLGCGPHSDTSRVYQPGATGDSTLSGPVVTMSETDVFELVQEQSAPEGEGTVVDWIERKLTSPAGQALFPRWQLQRRAANRFEVRFTYTWVERSNEIENRGFAWQVDGSLRTVEGPKEIAASSAAHTVTFSDQQQRRAQDPAYNLY